MISVIQICIGLIIGYTPTNKLSIDVRGITSQKGDLRIAIYRTTDDFPSNETAFKTKIQTAKNPTLVFDLPPNTYAFAIFHDVNKNGILDKNLFGVPTEKYAFSNNARGVFSPPSFSEAAFVFKENKSVTVLLK